MMKGVRRVIDSFSLDQDLFKSVFMQACQLNASHVHFKKTTASTNQDAKTMATADSADAVIIAFEQTAGRGRLGRQFFSPSGSGLYFSVLLHPSCSADQVIMLTTASAVFIAEALEPLVKQPIGIKWVNDLYIRHRKVCGILSESGYGANGRLLYTVVGIGVNVTDPVGGYPADIRQKAGSLWETHSPDSAALAEAIASIVNRLLAFSDTPCPNTVMPSYRKRNLLADKPVTFEKDGRLLSGTVCGIDDEAHLLVRVGSDLLVLSTGEITLHSTIL